MILMQAESQLTSTLLDRGLPGVSNKKILVVDDEPDIRNLLQLVFSNEGYTVLLAENGAAGIHLARTESPDVIFLDLLMPGLSGLEVCKLLKNNPVTEGIPVVVVTAFGRDRDIQLAKEAGADWFVKKPFENRKLVELAEKLIYSDKGAASPVVGFGADTSPQAYLMALSHAYLDESLNIFPSGFTGKMLEGYFKALLRFYNLPVLVEGSERVTLESLKSKYIEVLNGMGFADKFMLVEEPDMYIFQVIGCKHAGAYHHTVKSASFVCPHALFVGALIHTYVNPNVQMSKTALRKGGSITAYRKMDPRTKKYVNKSG